MMRKAEYVYSFLIGVASSVILPAFSAVFGNFYVTGSWGQLIRVSASSLLGSLALLALYSVVRRLLNKDWGSASGVSGLVLANVIGFYFIIILWSLAFSVFPEGPGGGPFFR